MPVSRDRVKDTSSTTGTGDITVSGTAPTGFQTFANAYSIGIPLTYAIVDNTSGLWETGDGYLSGATTLVRASPADGSSGLYTLVNFTAGTKDVFVTAAAHVLMAANGGAIAAKINGLAMP